MELEQYLSRLRAWAEQEKKLAEAAEDDREMSIHKMLASMYGPMLSTLGKVEIAGKNPGALAEVAGNIAKNAENLRAHKDFDAADREDIKLDAVRRVMRLIAGEEDV